jgi:hypothetical protein
MFFENVANHGLYIGNRNRIPGVFEIAEPMPEDVSQAVDTFMEKGFLIKAAAPAQEPVKAELPKDPFTSFPWNKKA